MRRGRPHRPIATVVRQRPGPSSSRSYSSSIGGRESRKGDDRHKETEPCLPHRRVGRPIPVGNGALFGSLQGGIVAGSGNTTFKEVTDMDEPGIRVIVAEDHPI